MAAMNRMLQLYVYDGDKSVAAPNGSLVYTFSTLAHERDLADQLAENKGCRLGEGHITVFDLEDDSVLNKLDCPA